MTRYAARFVTSIPEVLEPQTVYVSLEYATMMHLCACGCGSEIVTPLSPTGWRFCFDGHDITLSPSIGNWSYPCRSHYLIRSGRVVWAGNWDDDEVAAARARDAARTDDGSDMGGAGDDAASDRDPVQARVADSPPEPQGSGAGRRLARPRRKRRWKPW